jgi:hypothetical protein
MVPKLVKLLDRGSFSIQQQAAWALSNIAFSGTPNQVLHLVECEVIAPFCYILKVSDTQIVHVALEAILSILNKSSESVEKVCEKIEECGGVHQIEKLQVGGYY